MASVDIGVNEPTSPTSRLAGQSLSRAATSHTVVREEVIIAAASGDAAFVEPVNSDPAQGAYGLPTRNIPKACTVTPEEGNADHQTIAATTGLRFYGCNCYETSGSAVAKFIVRHGTSASDPILAVYTLNANESV